MSPSRIKSAAVFFVLCLALGAQGCKMGVTVVDNGYGAKGGERGARMLDGTEVKSIDGKIQKLDAYVGKVALVVNTASNCGFTGQYEGLQDLYEKYGPDDFVVLGFPCNDFGGQEPGTEVQIQEFCSAEFQVSFPMFEKVRVVGEDKHMFYKRLTQEGPESVRGDIKWNFTKFLLDREGYVLARFAPFVKPESDEVKVAIEKALSKGK